MALGCSRRLSAETLKVDIFMADFNVRSDSVNVEQIMDQIRARIRDKRGVDYTEEQIRELAAVKLEKFLDPRGVRSDLLEQFRRSQPPPSPLTVPLYPFEDTTLFDSHRGIVRFFRKLFRPLLKLFFNPNVLASSLHAQTVVNRQTVDRLDAIENSLRRNGDLYYELLHNMVVELTRASIEVKNAKMRVESIASRLEFNERRARALESVVVYKPADEREEAAAAAAPPRAEGAQPSRDYQRQPAAPMSARPSMPSTPSGGAAPAAGEGPPPGEGPGQRSRRRRRRGRRGGASAVSTMTPSTPGESAPAGASASEVSPSETPPSSAGPTSGSTDETDAREIRPEPFEHTFASSVHPAEPEPEAAATPAVPAPRESPASDSPDDDQ